MRRLGYVPAFDGLRGVAVLTVMLFHSQVPFGHGGFLGVDVFFVLSGFLITRLLIDEWRANGSVSLRGFYGRRAVRLLPALVVLLVVMMPFVPLTHILASLLYVANLAAAFQIQHFDLSAIVHTWSLAEEEQFYALWPAALLWMLHRNWTQRCIVAFPLVLALVLAVWRAVLWFDGASLVRIYYAPDTHADGLLIGSALGLASAWGMLRRLQDSPQLANALTVSSLITFAALAGVANDLTIRNTILFPLLALAVAVLVARLAILPSRPLIGLLSLRPLVGLGQISYGLYLWHVPLFALLRPSFVTAALALVCALLSYRYVERPIQRRWSARLRAVVDRREDARVDVERPAAALLH